MRLVKIRGIEIDLDKTVDVECYLNRRGVGRERIKDCTKCCRYGHDGCNLPIQNDDGALKVGYQVIYFVCEEYIHAFRDCAKNRLSHAEKWLRSERPNILSAEQYDGVAMLENLQEKCEKQYGPFEVRYLQFQMEHKAIMRELKEQLKVAETPQKRKKIKKEIDREKALLNA